MPDQLTIPGIGEGDLGIRTTGVSRRLFAVMTALSGILAGGWTFAMIVPAGLVNDDFANLDVVAGAERLTDTFLTPVFFTQLAPGHRLLTALQLEVGPLDRVVVHTLLATMIGLAAVLATLVGRRLYGRQPWVPVLVLLAVAGPATIRTNLWYAAAFHTTPSLVLGLASLLAHLRYRDDRSRRVWLALSVTCVTLGLTFSIRVALAVLVMVLVEQVLLRQHDALTTIRETWDRRGTWFWYVVPLAVYWYLERRFGSAPGTGDPGVVVESVLRGYVEVFGPLLVGFARHGTQTVGPQTPAWVIVVAHVAVVSVATLAVLRRRDAVRGLAAAGIVVLIGVGMSLLVRVVLFGVNASLALRYYTEPLVYAVLLLPWGFRGAPNADQAPTVRLLHGRVGQVVTAVGLVAVGAVSVWSSLAQVEGDSGAESARWLDAIEAAQADLETTTGVLDVPLDPAVMRAFPGRRFDVVDFLYPNLKVTSSLPALVVTETGDLEPAVPVELFRQTGRDLQTNMLVVTSGDAEVVGDAVCTASSLQLELVLAPNPLPRFAQVAVSGGAQLRMAYVGPDGGAPEVDAEVRVLPLEAPAVLPLDVRGTTTFGRLRVEAIDGGQACIDELSIIGLRNELPDSPLGPTLEGTAGK